MSETSKNGESQLDKFKLAARELECDDDDQRFKEQLVKLTKPRAAPRTDRESNT